MTALNKQALRSKARSASAGEWIKESGDGWEAICSADDQANGNFIIAHFEGPDAQANREFVQAANPDAVMALLDELEAAEKRIAELEAKLDSADKLQDSAFRHGLQHGFSLGQTDNQAGFEECLSAYGTGKGE